MPHLDLWGSTELWVLTGLCFLGTLVWRVIGTTVATHIEGFPIRHWIRAAEEGTTYEAFRPLMAYTSNWAFKSDSWGGTSDPRARLKKIATAVDVILPNHFPIQNCCGNFENKTADITRIAVDAG